MNSSLCARRHSAGFTLIELMIATSISGVLASVAYPCFSGALQKCAAPGRWSR
jgi:prepilin-type N-terminal cleavage/methylation domain-containing protein